MKRSFLACTAVLLALAACDHPNNPRVEATDGFGTNTLDVYTVYADAGSGWSIDNGELIGRGPATNSLLLWNGIAIGDGWVEADSRAVDDGGLVMKWIDNQNYYVLAMRDDSTRTGLATQNLALMKRSGGTFTTLATKDVAWARGTTHKVRFEAVGTRFIAYFDGAAQIDVTEPSATTPGRFGLRHTGTTATWVATYDVFRWQVPLRN